MSLPVDDEAASSSDDEEIPTRRCVVCLRRRRFTEDIFDSSKQLYYNIDVLIAHLNIEVFNYKDKICVLVDLLIKRFFVVYI